MKIGLILAGLWGAAALSAAVVEVRLTYPELQLKNGKSYRDVAINSFNPAIGTAVLQLDKKLTTVPLTLLPDAVNAKLKDLAPALTPDEIAAERRDAEAEKKRSLENAERRQRQAEDEARVVRDASRTTNLKDAERIQGKLDQLPAEVARVAKEEANNYFRYVDDPNSNIGTVTSVALSLEDPEPVPGWTGRYRVCGKVRRSYINNEASGFGRGFKEFEMLIDTTGRRTPKVVDITVK